ncbi:CD209 antigen-like protein C [Archocentrus centrarchus]|uniref:CD209 antigen-like protein C n=1 Tax=Archocentrus centrarchus TaxID=63155 RepID=UPI0011E9E3B9|nr:CD209 antigen-like protein C [Archocentrus centrarchus]
MEEIYVNAEYFKSDNSTPSTNHTGQRSSKRSLYLVLIFSLGLLSVFLLVGLITLDLLNASLSAVSNQLSSMTEERNLLNASLSAVSNQLSSMTEERDLLNASLSAVSNQLSSMTEERDLLNASLSAVSNQLSSMTEERDLLTENTKELKRLLYLANQNKACPAGWRKFSCSCYLLSERSDSWDAARKDCRDREADLVVIDSTEEQTFLSTVTKVYTWIGLNDKEKEGTWKWVDGTAVTLTNWAKNQPDDGGRRQNLGEENCAHIKDIMFWNDLSCSASLKWICEKTP